jgi:hypothetical protein
MADNIKIIGDVSNTQRLSRIKDQDLQLISPTPKYKTFGDKDDYIQYTVYDNQRTLLYSSNNYLKYKLPSNSTLTPEGNYPIIEINPVKDLEDVGYISGEFITQYNFNKSIISGPTPVLFIDEISEDRTEIRLNSTILSSSQLISWGRYLGSSIENNNEQISYILNFPDNLQFLIINFAVDFEAATPTLLLKLYEPLALNIVEKTLGWISEEIVEPYLFTVNLNTTVILPPPPRLNGPNFDIDLDTKQNLATKYESYNSLVSSLTGSSYYRVLNYMNDNSYDLNIDYTLFNNFIHFSSAKKRLEIFYDKIKQIEDYNSDIDLLLLSNSILKNEETSSIKLKIDNIVKNFDGFENYLYFESSSYSWPKATNVKPYKNKFTNKLFHQPITSSVWNFTHSLNEIPRVISVYSSNSQLLPTQSSTIGVNTISITFPSSYSGYVILTSPSTSLWYNSYTSSAGLYDEDNSDHLYNTLPEYIRNNSDDNQSYFDFIDMIGHYFDNIWIYITSINELYNADNNLEKGISKDIVYDALKSLGVKLYNSKGDDQFDDYIGGINNGSTIFVNDFSVTSSFLNNIPKKDQLAELYKRIYHNIPLLSKTKGTAAGLQNLITTFGITGSIFQPKEFGGSTKINELKGYDNDKITIQNNTITGSVLSPFISLQNSPSSSTEFTSTDLHFIDLSFSPQNELNTRISASVAIAYPTFSLDEYIGDPRSMGSSSYDSLNIFRDTFISASAAVSGSAKRLDYKGFIELVKYFDNSLFKMLKDFVPARANTLTGITIKSPVLERNKIPTNPPNVTEQEIQEANYNSPVISEDKDYYYDKISGNKSSFYTGELIGSYANINDTFELSNPNPYLFPPRPIDVNKHNHSDFNVYLNNISSSVLSISRKKLEPLYLSSNSSIFASSSNGKISEIDSNAELQDSYEDLLGHQNSRYDGTKIYSLKYNEYSTASLNYEGDKSFGKTSVINYNTNKLGLFTSIDEDIFFKTKKNNVYLKYLVDKDGNLTELNKYNKHWEEVQNVFKSGTKLTVAQFDTQQNNNQKTTDGIKPIYNSGYSYTPMLYFTGSLSTDKLYFKYSGDDSSKLFKANNIASSFISGSGNGNERYPLKASGSANDGYVIYNIFNNILINDDLLYTVGTTSPPSASNAFPFYTAPSNGSYVFNSSLGINIKFQQTDQTCTFKYDLIKGGIDIANGFPTGSTPGTSGIVASSGPQSFKSSYTANIYATGDSLNEEGAEIVFDGGSLADIPIGASKLNLSNGLVLTHDAIAGNAKYTDQTSKVWYSLIVYWNLGGTNRKSLIFSENSTSRSTFRPTDMITTVEDVSGIQQNKEGNIDISLNTEGLKLDKGEKVYFKLSFVTSSTHVVTASFYTPGELKNNLTSNVAGDNIFANGSSDISFIQQAVTSSTSTVDTLVLNQELSAFENYTFIPNLGSSDQSRLYARLGLISDSFFPNIGDTIIISWKNENSIQSTEFDISNIFYSGSNKCVTLNGSIPSSLISSINGGNLTPAGVDEFILLKKNKDESNLLLSFDKLFGATSFGFIIPDNIHSDVLNNIDIITKEVKQKLLENGNNGGSGTF